MSTVSTNDALVMANGAGLPEPMVKIRPPHGWAALDLSSVWRFRDLLLALASRDVKLRYKQTALGVVWVLLQPLMAAGVLSFVFGKIGHFNADGLNVFEFTFAGFLGWNLFNNTVSKSSVCLVGNSQLISKIFFPRLVLPFSTVPSALIDFSVATVMMAILLVMFHTTPTLAILTFPIWIVLLLMLATGIGLWAAALTVPYRDVQYLLPVFLNLLMYASPVAYSVHNQSHLIQMIFNMNPLAPLLEGLRWSLMPSAPPTLGVTIFAAVLSVAVLIVGAFVFKRMERKFADVI
jgi:lipopolysaccharide transport system permease protein